MGELKTEKQVKHNTKIKVYPDGRLHLTCFTRDVFRDDGWEYIYDDEIKETSEHVEYDTSNTRSDSLKRSKGKIFDIALSNEWDYMITLTLDAKRIDRYDPKEIIMPFRKWLNNMVFRYGMKYLIVPEYHEDGAIHFHGLVKSSDDSLKLVDSGTVKVPNIKKPIKVSTAKRKKIPPSEWRTVFNLQSYTLGYSSAVRIDNNVEAVSKYMTKYTCKNFQKIFGKSFFAGGGVNRELPTFFLDVPYVRLEAEEFRLPDNLGAVKYLTLDQSTFDLLLKEWSS